MTDLTDFPQAPPGAYVENGWLIYGDQAWTVGEWRSRIADRMRYHTNPARRAAVLARAKEYQRKNRDKILAGKREAYRRKRMLEPRVVGSLHDLACTGPTKSTGCRCRKIRAYAPPLRRAA